MINEAHLGTIAPGETKGFLIELPPGVHPGDAGEIEIEYVCGSCHRHRSHKFKVTFGGPTQKFKFRCDCNTIWYKLKKFFAGWRKL